MAFLATRVQCAVCSHVWAAVRPYTGTAVDDLLDCPQCKHQGEVTNLSEDSIECGHCDHVWAPGLVAPGDLIVCPNCGVADPIALPDASALGFEPPESWDPDADTDAGGLVD